MSTGPNNGDHENGDDSVIWINPDVSGTVYASSFQDSVTAYCEASGPLGGTLGWPLRRAATAAPDASR